MAAFNIVVAGLGGQGVLFVSKALALAASREHDFVCRTESRGLSQRGGSVSSEVRFSSRPVTPVVAHASADLLLSMDMLEAVRFADLVKHDGTILTHTELVPPLHLSRQWNGEHEDRSRAEFNERISRVLQYTIGAIMIDLLCASRGARLNVALLGAASSILPIKAENVRSAALRLTKPADRDSTAAWFDSARFYALQAAAAAKISSGNSVA